MRKTWSGSYQRLDGEEPIPPPVDSSGSLGDSSIKGSNVFLAPGPILHSVDSDLRFHPAAVLKSTRRWLHIDQHGLAKHVEVSDLGRGKCKPRDGRHVGRWRCDQWPEHRSCHASPWPGFWGACLACLRGLNPTCHL